MNRIWVRLWLGMALAGVGFVASFTFAALLASGLSGDRPGTEGQLALITTLVGFGGTGVISMVVAAVIARRLARPLIAVSAAARRVAEGDLSARVALTRRKKRPRKQANQRRWALAFRRSKTSPRKRRPRRYAQARARVRRRQRRRAQRQRHLRSGETQRLLEDFNSMAASLERLEAERQATTAAIAHDLRTPLTILWGRLAGARDGLIALDAAEVALLLGQTELLARMVEDLRTLSLAEAGRLSLRRTTFDLAALVQQVGAGYIARAETKRVSLVVVAAQPTEVTADADRLQQVLSNLLDNALRFAPAGGTVWLGLEATPRAATLRVRDNGPGIGEAALGHIFTRFYREDSSRSGAGTGLGLAIVHSLVSLHGGTVTAGNQPSGGAIFEVTLPRAQG